MAIILPVGRDSHRIQLVPSSGSAKSAAPWPMWKGTQVSQVCDVCGKSPQFGKSISHSHRRTNRRWTPNIQSVRTNINGTSKRLHVCTSCIKAGKVQRAL